MFQLIKKDIVFNWKWVLLLVLIAIILPVVFYIDREETRLTLIVYIVGAVLANSHFVSKSCYLDDNTQTRRFLASLPVKKTQLVVSKYLLGLLCIVVTLFLTTASSVVLGLHPNLQGLEIASIYLLLYYAVFLGVFFRSNYSSAEKANASLQMLTIISVFVIDRSGLHLDEMSINPAFLLAGLGICTVIYAASLLFSIRSLNRYLVIKGI